MSHGFGRADTYLGQELARLDVGPLRACYLVPDHDCGRLMEAITAASRRWGGVTEPILAVGPDGFTDQRWRRSWRRWHPSCSSISGWMSRSVLLPPRSWARA